MRHALTIFVVLAAGIALAADDPKTDKKPINLEGTYYIVGLELGGEKLPEDFFVKGPEESRKIVIKGDMLIASKGGKDDPASFKIDTTKSPAHIDITAKAADGKDDKMFGIFKLDGDTLTICAVQSEKAQDRPKEFKTSKDSKAMIMVMKKKGK